jgi:UDP-N-acetylmuramoyl-tripeptide--D-alanyl-D-alanine ligase
MTSLFMVLTLSVWVVGTAIRVIRLARFYQIEEYKNGRFVRWLFGQRARWLPNRWLGATFAGVVVSLLFSEGGALVPGIGAVMTAVIGIWPPSESEIKKPLRRTPRVMRMIVMAIIISTAVAGSILAVLVARAGGSAFGLAFAIAAGAALWLLSPVWLTLGSILMLPVDVIERQRFLRSARRVLEETRPVVIGITGSYGKTTTKTFLAHILAGRYKVYPTPKSYNTLMGVSRAINEDLARDRSIEYFICEMGAYIPGEIRRICDLTHPTMSLVVEVGPQHLERFGSLENIAIAKYEIVAALPPDGAGFFNWDNPYVRGMAERGYPAERISVSRRPEAEAMDAGGPRLIAADESESLDGLSFTLHDRFTGVTLPCHAPIYGIHNVTNILLAAAVALHEGMTLKEIVRRIATLEPAESRLVRQASGGITVLNDAYSANPVGAVSALRVLAMHTSGRRLLITPGMVELADQMDIENRKLGIEAARTATDVILVGEEQTRAIHSGLVESGFPKDRLLVVDTLGEAITWYHANLKPGDTVLFLNDLPDTYSRI